MVARALDRELNLPGATVSDPSKPVVVNDLTSMVVKRKKKPVESNGVETNGSGKRKAEDDAPIEPKKAKVEEANEA